MKYCPKCGHEMSDQASFCEVCGNAFAGAQAHSVEVPPEKVAKARSKFTTSVILNIAAFVVCMLFYSLIFVSAANPEEPHNPNDYDLTITVTTDPHPGFYGLSMETIFLIMMFAWPTLAIVVLVLGIIAVKKRSKKLAYAYLTAAYVMLVALFVINPNMLNLVMCGFGVFIFAPTLLQTISGIMLLRALNEDAA